MSDKTKLGDRMKTYEDSARTYLPIRMPLILRCDGKGFSNWTKSFEKPWSTEIRDAFVASAEELFSEVQGLKLAYCQSDEMSLLITDYDSLYTTPYFDKNLQKIVSVVSSIVTATFNDFISDYSKTDKLAYFDCRAFVVPKEDVNNYFLWRQKDAIRNSVSVLAQSQFSHKELHKKKSQEKKDMLKSKGIDWDQIDAWKRSGYAVTKQSYFDWKNGKEFVRSKVVYNFDIPIFSQDKTFVEDLVYIGRDDQDRNKPGII